MILEAILEEASAQADLRNDEMILRLLKAMRDNDPRRCRYCYHKFDYVFFKLAARRLKKRLSREVDEDPDVLKNRMGNATERSKEAHEKMKKCTCLCGGETWDRIETNLFFRGTLSL